MANNLFIVLPAPSADGSGAWTDCSTLGALRTVTVGGTVRGQLTVEISNEAVATKAAALFTVQNAGQRTLVTAAHWMRVTISGYKSGVPDINVGGSDDGCLFANLAAPAGNGVAAGTDVTALGSEKTITIGGPFKGSVTIESSEDNSQYFPLKTVQAPGQFNMTVVAQYMRVRRSGVPSSGAGTPLVNVGADESANNPGFRDPVIFSYTVTGLEPDLSEITIPLPAARLDDDYLVLFTSGGVVNEVTADIPPGTKTVAQFLAIFSADLTAGDLLTFLVANP